MKNKNYLKNKKYFKTKLKHNYIIFNYLFSFKMSKYTIQLFYMRKIQSLLYYVLI